MHLGEVYERPVQNTIKREWYTVHKKEVVIDKNKTHMITYIDFNKLESVIKIQVLFSV